LAKNTKKVKISDKLTLIGSSLFVLAILFPIYSAILASLTPLSEIGSNIIFPVYFHFQNYVEVVTNSPLILYLLNSFIYTLGSSAVILICAIPAAYALSRFKLKGYRYFLSAILITQMIPYVIVSLTIVYVVKGMGLLDTRIGVIFVVSAVLLAFPIWYLRSYFDTIPTELDEVAMIDGCSRVGAAIRVVLPVSLPGIFTIFILIVQLSWQMFLLPLILLSSTDKFPITVALYNYLGGPYVPWNLLMAMTIISILPPLGLFFFASRKVISGLTAGSLKY